MPRRASGMPPGPMGAAESPGERVRGLQQRVGARERRHRAGRAEEEMAPGRPAFPRMHRVLPRGRCSHNANRHSTMCQGRLCMLGHEMAASAGTTLPGRDYRSPEVFELDRERVFFREWIYVGARRRGARAGRFRHRRRRRRERPRRARQGRASCARFYNVCRHRGSRICDAETRGHAKGAIKCPYHAWTLLLRREADRHAARRQGRARPLDARPVAGAPRGVAGLRLRQPRASRAGRCASRSSASSDKPLQYERWRMDELRTAPPTVERGRRRTGRSSSRTTTSASTARPSIPSSRASRRRSGRGSSSRTGRHDWGVSIGAAASATPRPGRRASRSCRGSTTTPASAMYGATVYPNMFIDLTGTVVIATRMQPRGAGAHDDRHRLPVPARGRRRSRTSTRPRWSSSPSSSPTRTTSSASACSTASPRARSRTACTPRRTTCRTGSTSVPGGARPALSSASSSAPASRGSRPRMRLPARGARRRRARGERPRRRPRLVGAARQRRGRRARRGVRAARLRRCCVRPPRGSGLELLEKGTLYGDREPRDGPPCHARGAASQPWRGAGGRDGGSVAARARRGSSGLAGCPRRESPSRLAVSSAHELEDQAARRRSPTAPPASATSRVTGSRAATTGSRTRSRLVSTCASAAVSRVAWSGDGVVIRAASEVAADACVIATPARTRSSSSSTRRCPTGSARRSPRVRYGQAAKLFLPLVREVAAERDALGAACASGRGPSTGRASSSSFAGTAVGARAARDRERAGAVGGGGPPAPARASLRGRRARPRDVARAARTRPARSRRRSTTTRSHVPSVPIAFAGEHTAGAWHGLMEGALRSGLRAAAQLRSVDR